MVEKILAAHEHLPESWPVHGTTGYDFAATCSGLFVDAGAADHFTRIYQGFIRPGRISTRSCGQTST